MKNMERIDKPWGYYWDIFRSEKVVLKGIFVKKDEEISFQKHFYRDEFWFIEKGRILFRIGHDTNNPQQYNQTLMFAGCKINICHSIWHQAIALEDTIIYEMQCGECREDDIVRYQDKYGRN